MTQERDKRERLIKKVMKRRRNTGRVCEGADHRLERNVRSKHSKQLKIMKAAESYAFLLLFFIALFSHHGKGSMCFAVMQGETDGSG